MADLADGEPFVHLEGQGGNAGFFENKNIFLSCARVIEGFSQLTRTTVEFRCRDKSLALKEIVGKAMNLKIETFDKGERKILGRCVSAKFLGVDKGFAYFTAEVRPWLWFLTRRANSRVFQELSVPDIIAEVLGDNGFSDFTKKLQGSYEPREYCVQYRETDFDFLQRLMEEEGIYYFFTHEGAHENMVLADGLSAHTAVPGAAEIEYHPRRSEYRRDEEKIHEWQAMEFSTSGEVTLTDFDFEKPKADLKVSKKIPKGDFAEKTFEIYDYPGHHRDTGLGNKYARVKMEAKAVTHQTWTGVCNVRTMAAGQTFQMTDHPRVSDSAEFLLTQAAHYFQVESARDRDATFPTLLDDQQDIGAQEDDRYRCIFSVIPKQEQYRAPLVTPWPEIVGVQTATVVGPSGEEIHTDKYGRIKVQFHWDRLGEKDDTSSCWVRVMMPWTGKNWGMIHIPRLGQEVVVQFEEGDPDRPIVVGMLYNADTMPPYALPSNKTQSGVKTNSSKEGGGFNELMFEDKKGTELVRFQAQHNYRQIVKNDAEITVGLETKKEGDMTTTIHRHLTETLKTGDHTFVVEEGSEERTIAVDMTETIGGNETITVGKDSTIDIGSNSKLTIGSNLKQKVGSNMTLDVGAKLTIQAGASIELKVGGSSIKIEPTSVTISTMSIKADASMDFVASGGLSAEMSGGVSAKVAGGVEAKVEGGAMAVLKGSALVQIN